jgi:hypothetical protein
MKYVFGTAIVTAVVAANLRELSRRLDKEECDGMFTTPLSVTGNLPATHYISTGWIPVPYAQTIRDPILLFQRGKKAWEDDGDVFPFTQNQEITMRLVNGTLSVIAAGSSARATCFARNGPDSWCVRIHAGSLNIPSCCSAFLVRMVRLRG